MTQEEKARAYDKAIEKINSKWHYKNQPCFVDAAEIFPELKESEDEEVRQAMIKFFKSERIKNGIAVLHFGVNIEKMISWLEKQSEQKWSEEDSLMIDSIIDTIKWLEGKGATNMKIDWLKSLKQRMEE